MGAHALLKNISVAFFAQLSVLIGGGIATLILPRTLGVTEFGYWQLLLLYVGYAGAAHLGLNDGVYLLNGGKSLEELDNHSLSSQFRVGLVAQITFGAFLGLFAVKWVPGEARRDVFLYTAIIMVLTNAASYVGFVLQAVNRTRIYSMSIVVRQATYLIGIVALVLLGASKFQPYAVVNALASAAALLFLLWFGRSFIFCKGVGISNALRGTVYSIKVGSSLLVAGLASMLITGMSRFIVDGRWGIDEFSIYSLAITLTGLVMLFASQVGMVLFPALRRFSGARLTGFYTAARDLLDWALPSVFVLYYPVVYFIRFWLPEYVDAATMLALLLPVAVFDTKMSILGSTILKVVRRERYLLAINLAAVTVSGILMLIAVYMHSLILVACGVSLAVGFRYALADWTVSRELGAPRTWTSNASAILTAVFSAVAFVLDPSVAFPVTILCYIVFTMVQRKRITLVVLKLRDSGKNGTRDTVE